jgi:uncharacterized protein
MRALVFLFVFFACAILTGIIGKMVMTAAPAAGEGAAADAQQLNTTIVTLIISSVITIALTVIFRCFIDRRSVKNMGFQWSPFQPDALIGFSLGIALLGAATLLLFATGNITWSEARFNAGDLAKGFFLMALIALTEEMVFRAYILSNLMESLNKWAALGASAVIFAMAHCGNPGISSVGIANLVLAGLLLGINYIYTRNIWFAVLFHFSWNFVQGPVLGYPVSGLPLQSILQPELKGPWWLTGSTFGIEGSFITTSLFTLAALLLYFIYEKNTGKTVKASQ